MANKRLLRGLIIVAVSVAMVIILPGLWASLAAGLLGGLLVAWTFSRPNNRRVEELNLLEPIKFVEGEGGWQVRLDAYGRAEVVRVLNRSLDIDVIAAMRIIRKLPRVLVREATEEHALELVNRLRRAGATAEAIPPAD